jgi:hypothetical protein
MTKLKKFINKLLFPNIYKDNQGRICFKRKILTLNK